MERKESVGGAHGIFEAERQHQSHQSSSPNHSHQTPTATNSEQAVQNTPEPTPSSVPEQASPPAPAITRTNRSKGALSSSFWIR
jgi:hypothetical protein